MKRKSFLLVIVTGLLFFAVPGQSEQLIMSLDTPVAVKDFYLPLEPQKAHINTAKSIIRKLKFRHYRSFKLDDSMSSKIFDRYLADLDRNRSYFLQSDIDAFEVYRYQIDDALQDAEMAPAYAIFNRYQQRLVERLVFAIQRLEHDIEKVDFTVDEEVEIDRSDAQWPKTIEELNDLWRRQLKAALLSLKLAGKSLDEAAKTLDKRYRSQLNRTRQTASEDVFQIYMNSLAKTLDPHTQYFSPRSMENFNINMSLSLEGIGAVLQFEDEFIKIVRLVVGGPAEKSGQLKPGDRIAGVAQGDGGEMVDVVGWRIDEVVQLIRGPKGTVVRMDIIPVDSNDNHTTRMVRIVRNKVRLEEQAAQKKVLDIEREGRKYKIGVIDVPTFYADFRAMNAGETDYRSTTSDVKRLLRELMAVQVDGLVIDLRDNGGGSLQEASTMTGLFIDRGPTVLVRSASGRINLLKDYQAGVLYSGPLVVLVNRLSASASEIFAGAIQDYQRGIVIGEQTYGKGTVQALLSLDRGQLKSTTAKFYRVSGASTQHKGVMPDLYYPSLYDSEKIGESALEGAMPWDTIKGAKHDDFLNLAPYIPELARRYHQRMAADPDYEYLLARRTQLEKMRLKNTLSLNESIRREERQEDEAWRLAVENKRRVAKNMKPLEKLPDAFDGFSRGVAGHDGDKDGENDPAALAGADVIIDLIALLQQSVAGTNNE